MRLALFTFCEKSHKLEPEVAQYDSAVDVALNVRKGGLQQVLDFAVLGFVDEASQGIGLKGNVRKPRK